MRFEILFEAGLSLAAVFAMLVYVVRLDRKMGRSGVDWSIVLIALAALGVLLLVVTGARR